MELPSGQPTPIGRPWSQRGPTCQRLSGRGQQGCTEGRSRRCSQRTARRCGTQREHMETLTVSALPHPDSGNGTNASVAEATAGAYESHGRSNIVRGSRVGADASGPGSSHGRQPPVQPFGFDLWDVRMNYE